MFGLILLLLIVVPVVELYVLFQVADSFGWLVSFIALFGISMLGGTLMRWQTAGQFGRITDKIQRGEMPSKELVDGALMIFGGALLLTPGFFTDAVGLAMFIPPLRAIVRRLILRRITGRVAMVQTAGTQSFGMSFGFGGQRPGSFIDTHEVPEDVHVERDDLPAIDQPPNGSPKSENT